MRTSAFLGRRYSIDEVAELAYRTAPADCKDTWHVINLTSIVMAESGGYEWAININTTEGKYYASVDAGLAQLNSVSVAEFYKANYSDPFNFDDLLFGSENLGLAWEIAQDAARRFKTWRADWRWWSTWRDPNGGPGVAREPTLVGKARHAVNDVRRAEGKTPL